VNQANQDKSNVLQVMQACRIGLPTLRSYCAAR
jgi:hypothetical protein